MTQERSVALRPKQVTEDDIATMSAAEIVLIHGDLSVLSAPQRVEYYAKVCESLGLNPLTSPFAYLLLNGKLVLYAKRDATDQLREIRGISVYKLEKEQTADTYDVTAYGRVMSTNREDSSLGSVPITNLRGEALSNAKMKAETKAKRRLTLSLAGLGILDETEVASVAGAQPIIVTDAGEIVEEKPKTLAEAVARAVAPSVTPEPPGKVPGPPAPPPAPEGDGGTVVALPDQAEEADPYDAVIGAALVGVVEGIYALDSTVEGPETTGVDNKTFMHWVSSEAFVPSGLIKAAAKDMFGDTAKSVRDLTDQQRFALQVELTKRLDAARHPA